MQTYGQLLPDLIRECQNHIDVCYKGIDVCYKGIDVCDNDVTALNRMERQAEYAGLSPMHGAVLFSSRPRGP
jgi:hypothetical protein